MVQQIQAMEWMENLSEVETGGGRIEKVIVIHCIEEGTVTAHFPNGDENKSFTAGMDRTLNGVAITIDSGKFDINVR